LWLCSPYWGRYCATRWMTARAHWSVDAFKSLKVDYRNVFGNLVVWVLRRVVIQWDPQKVTSRWRGFFNRHTNFPNNPEILENLRGL
jgi:hypothetical protein